MHFIIFRAENEAADSKYIERELPGSKLKYIRYIEALFL